MRKAVDVALTPTFTRTIVRASEIIAQRRSLPKSPGYLNDAGSLPCACRRASSFRSARRFAAPTKYQLNIKFTNGMKPQIVHLRTFRPLSWASRRTTKPNHKDIMKSGRNCRIGLGCSMSAFPVVADVTVLEFIRPFELITPSAECARPDQPAPIMASRRWFKVDDGFNN